MKWRLGLDLGTNSIGWAVLSLDSDNKPECLIDMGSRIFSDGREPKTGESLAVARRTARGIRRNLRRRKDRRRKLFLQLRRDGLFPQEKEAAKKLKAMNPYELRTKGLDAKLEAFELGRALFHLGVRRGFKSNRKDRFEKVEEQKTQNAADDNQRFSQTEKCEQLANAIRESGMRTLGEFLWKNRYRHNGIRFTPERTVFYPLRKMYEDEFDLLRQKQKMYYPDVHWDKIKDIIFYQRPLRPQERGKCQFMTDKERTFKAMPCSHKYRILQEIYNLKYYDALNNPITLTEHEQDLIIQTLDTTKGLSFNKIRKLLKIEGDFNLETTARTKLEGNDTAIEMRKETHFGSLWDTLSLEEQDDIVETLLSADDDEDVSAMLKKYSLSDEQKLAITKLVLKPGTVSLCRELEERLVHEMEKKRIRFDEALASLGYSHFDDSVEKCDKLPYYGQVLIGSTIGGNGNKNEIDPEKRFGKIGNPTVHVALNQIKTVVNALIKEYGKPTQIVLELSRELKASKEHKKLILQNQAINAKRNILLNKKITDLHKGIRYPGRTERRKMKLWEELGTEGLPRRCLYCGKPIAASELFTKNIEIEHILPYSRTLLGSESNLTVAHALCNEKKGQRTPFEAFGTSPDGFVWNEIMYRVSMLRNPVKQRRFASDAMENFEKNGNFIDRQLTDTQYVSKTARKYLCCIMDNPLDVWVLSGTITKQMRDIWRINRFLNREIDDKTVAEFNLKSETIGEMKKNRYDHRHHALDAMVIALTDRAMLQKIAYLNKTREKKAEAAKAFPPLPFSPADIIEKLQNIVVSFKPDHGTEGKLSKETLLGCIKQEKTVPIKELKENEVEHIKNDRVREEFEELTAERGSFKQAVKELQEVYPVVKVFKPVFVSRTTLTSLKNETNIDDIVDTVLREKLRRYRAEHPQEQFEKLLVSFGKETGIKKIRCKTFGQTPITIPANSKKHHYIPRYLNPEDYFCAIIWQIPPKKDGKKAKYEAQYIRRGPDDIGKDKKPIEKKPHPAARKICLLAKNDYIEFAENGLWKKARIAGFSATQNKLDIRPVYAAKDIASWITATNERMLEKGWKRISAQNYVSVNVLFGENSARQITVSPIGRVFRKANKN